MNTVALARLYDQLTPKERLPLIIAAMDRGDQAEADRLSRSAPTVLHRMPDYFGLGDALQMLALFHMIEQLERATIYWHGSSIVGQWFGGNDMEGHARQERWRPLLRLVARRLTVEAAAWKQVLTELKIDPETLLGVLPGYRTLKLSEAAAALDASTPEEVLALLRESGADNAKVVTIEDAAQALRHFLDWRTVWWG